MDGKGLTDQVLGSFWRSCCVDQGRELMFLVAVIEIGCGICAAIVCTGRGDRAALLCPDCQGKQGEEVWRVCCSAGMRIK